RLPNRSAGRTVVLLRRLRARALRGAQLPQPSLSPMPGGAGGRLAGATAGRPVAHPVFPSGVHVAPWAQRAAPPEPARSLQITLRGRQPDVVGVWPQPIEGAVGDHGGAAHLEPDVVGSLSSALHRQRRRVVVGGQGLVWSGKTGVPRPVPVADGRQRVRLPTPADGGSELGGVCQAALCRPQTSAGLSVPL